MISPDILLNPFRLLKLGWPHIKLADYQADILASVSGIDYRTNERIHNGTKITVVPAANMMGKDFIASFIALWFYVSRSPARVVTTSIDYDQLNGVLWGEIRRWLETCKIPLGLHVNHLHLRQVNRDGSLVGLSEMVGKTAQPNKKEGLLGRHVARGPDGLPMALFIGDEASGLQDCHVQAAETWAHQMLFIGNCYPTTNFFYRYTKAGDQDDPTIDYKKTPNAAKAVKVIRIIAEQSPNVRLGMRENLLGLPISHTEVLPGCMSYAEYMFRRTSPEWTEERQAIGLDAQFYEGAQIKLFPPDWLAMSIEAAALLDLNGIYRRGKTLGCDPAEGSDDTVFTVSDDLGMIKQIEESTPDTSVIHERTIAIGEEFGIPPECWWFDAGGGGKQIVQLLNRKGYAANFVPFGGSPYSPERKDGHTIIDPKTIYVNRRAQIYGEIREAINPHDYDIRVDKIDGRNVEIPIPKAKNVFGIPESATKLLAQMRPIPLTRDEKDRLFLLPKNSPKKNAETLTKLLGRSPDHLDSLGLSIHGKENPVDRVRVITL